MIYLVLAGFTMMVLQTALTYLQYRNYQAAVNSLIGKEGKCQTVGTYS